MLDHFGLKSGFGEGCVGGTVCEWEYSGRRGVGVIRWKKVKTIGAGAYGSVTLEKEESGRQLRAVKRMHRHEMENTGFSHELAALFTLSDVCTPSITAGLKYEGW